MSQPGDRAEIEPGEQSVDEPHVGSVERAPQDGHRRPGYDHGEEEGGPPERAEEQRPVEGPGEGQRKDDLERQMDRQEYKGVDDGLPEASIPDQVPDVV